jgi:phage terminase large subunit
MLRRRLSHASRLQLVLASILLAILVWVVDTALDSLMIHFHSSRRELLFLSRAVTAVLAGCMMLWVLFIQRSRQIETEQRMEVIGEMNHHVRNALQVISYWGVQERDRQQLRFIHEAVDRIEWALRDVLPRGVADEQADRYNRVHELPAAVPGRRR